MVDLRDRAPLLRALLSPLVSNPHWALVLGTGKCLPTWRIGPFQLMSSVAPPPCPSVAFIPVRRLVSPPKYFLVLAYERCSWWRSLTAYLFLCRPFSYISDSRVLWFHRRGAPTSTGVSDYSTATASGVYNGATSSITDGSHFSR